MNRLFQPRGLLSLTALTLGALLTTPPAEACMGTPPPLCGKTLSFSTSAPETVLAPGGDAIDVSVPGLAFFNVIEAPAGACLPLDAANESASLEVAVAVDCTGPNDGTGTLPPTTVGNRFTDVDLTVSLDAGPPRVCEITSTANATLNDGTVLTAVSNNNVCVGEGAPGNPDMPRIEVERLSPDIERVHPGDQTSFSYLITNNDPVESFSGKLSVALVNTSRLPQQTPPSGTPSDDGPYAVSSPLQGDNFPIGFTEDLVNGCLYVPKAHDDPEPSTLTKQINLGPGESIDVDIFARPFGGCADGSCGRAKVLLDGQFTDMTAGFACTGFVAAADTSVPPRYQWADSGAVLTNASTPEPWTVQFDARPDGEQTVSLIVTDQIPQFVIGGEPVEMESIAESFPYDGELGRITETIGMAGTPLAPGGTSFTYEDEVVVVPGVLLDFDFSDFQPSSPSGFENVAPGTMIEIGFRSPGQTQTEFFVDLAHQVSAEAQFIGGEKLPVSIDSLSVSQGPNADGFLVSFTGAIPDADGADVEFLKVTNDLRGFARAVGDYDQDGVVDHLDNCILEPNADQRDTDADNFGNICDADLNNDNIINVIDLAAIRARFFSSDPDADFNGDGIVNFIDLGRIKDMFFGTPGPSGL